MSSHPRGICLIVNNVHFQSAPSLPGGDANEKLLSDLFKRLDFKVVVKQNLMEDEIRKTAEQFAVEDHSNYKAFVFYILSHGGENDVIAGVDRKNIAVSELVCLFTAANCPTLQGKPKLFFIQACRGARPQPPSPAANSDSSLSTTASPPEADFLLAFSTTQGYKSYRTSKGSLFTRTFVDVMNKRNGRHLLEILVKTRKKVMALPKDIFHVPVYTHSLTKYVYL